MTTNVGLNVGKGKSYTELLRMETSATSMKINLGVENRTAARWTAVSSSTMIRRPLYPVTEKNLCSLGLNTIARACNQPRCLSINEKNNKCIYTYAFFGWVIYSKKFISLQESSEKECTQFITKR